ncbi:MAG: hypothetical protein JWO64_2011 [Hyphomicrobiales bacterium]|jgi:hypothetical protein|nr:hypothetical protein [Hyphomicrobiales bacterium]
MSNIGAQLRDNPLPLLLISAGVGLMMSRSFRSDGYRGGFGMYRDDASGDLMRRTADPTAGFGNERDDYGSRAASASSGMMSSVRDTVSSVTDTVSQQASSLADTVRDTYSSSVDRMSDMTDRAGDYTNRARSGLSTLATEQPLVLGALGLLAGAALAAMLPRTQIEEEYVGSAARQLRDQASDMASDTFERAKGAASKAVEAASQEFSGEQEKSSNASGGPSQSGVSSPGGTSTSGAAALGVSTAGAGGARPSETISAGTSGQGAKSKV